jgi:hypothetical protein
MARMYQRTPQFAPVRQPWRVIAAGLLALATAHAAAGGESAAFGFSPGQFPRQQALEQRFDGELNPSDLRAANRYVGFTAGVPASATGSMSSPRC